MSSVKTYLQDQVRLVTLSSNDLFTDDEYSQYVKIVQLGNTYNERIGKGEDKDTLKPILCEKEKLKEKLSTTIQKRGENPRVVNLNMVVHHSKDSPYPFPKGITWKNLKITRRIAEFSCELTRAMGLNNLDCTLDLIVIKWKDLNLLKQLVLYGFYMPILHGDEVEMRHYQFLTASAGQLRRDKTIFISDEMWNKIHRRIECGMNWERINAHGGIVANKLLAYIALANSATDVWTDFDIDQCIVIDDFEAEVTDRMMYIKEDYSYEIGKRTVMINHTDGCGMMLPTVSKLNFMTRLPFIKGLLVSFDYIKFCKINNVPPIIKDIYGKEHDLIKENIQIIFTKSMFKAYKYFESFEEYKEEFKACGAQAGITNYEEEYIPDATLNYQFIQTLVNFTDEEIQQFIKNDHDKIEKLGTNKDSMLNTLGARKESDNPYKAALAYYPELLREAYSKETIRAIRKSMMLDAKSGKIHCENKRLFAVPDLYAACERWFMGIEEPEGLLKGNEIACLPYRRHDKADVLRSPH